VASLQSYFNKKSPDSVNVTSRLCKRVVKAAKVQQLSIICIVSWTANLHWEVVPWKIVNAWRSEDLWFCYPVSTKQLMRMRHNWKIQKNWN